MLKDSPKSLADLIRAENNPLGRLAEQARSRATLADGLRKALPAELAGGVLHCNLRDDGTLVVVCPNSAWASRLRFEEKAIRDYCTANGYGVASIRVTVG